MTIRTHKDGSMPDWQDPDNIFVFGSNAEGYHAGGAARAAYDYFGAEWGKPTGLQGQSYAIATMSYNKGVPAPLLEPQVFRFLRYAEEMLETNPEVTFYVTRIGCGIAGLKDEEIAPLFWPALPNVSYPPQWVEIFEELDEEA